MQELDDAALLREYAEGGSEEAFAALVARHVNKIYSVALRHTRNPHQAEEITQTVFVTFAQKARGLGKAVVMSGWFYETARLAAITLLRSEIRRSRREQESLEQSMPNETDTAAWTQIAPSLDPAMSVLGATDRHAVVLRFFDGKSMREVGAALGASEDAAKKRVNRAVEKLRRYFAKRGVALTAAALTAAISDNSVQAAPPALAKTIVAAGLAKGTVSGASTLTLVNGAIKIMAWTKLKIGAVALVAAGVTATWLIQQREREDLLEQNASLRGQIAELQTANNGLSRRAAARRPLASGGASAEGAATVSPAGNLYARLLKNGETPKLTPEQVEPYLRANGRNAASLLAAFRATGDTALLREALRDYPNDPRAGFAAAVDKDLSPEERRQGLDAFKKAAPDNAMANYLSALDYFKSGNREQAAQELVAAAAKPQFQDYSRDFVQNAGEIYLSAGYSTAEAKTLSSTGLVLPQLADLRQLGQAMVDLAATYRQAGDASSAGTTLQMAANLGQSYASAASEQAVSQLVGIHIETTALSAMSPASPYGDTGETVQDRINELAQQKAALAQLARQVGPIMETMSDQDWISFNDRLMVFGEASAMQWLVAKNGTK
jgi:RNA polymerase sigma factor (sigma-70 family)